MEGKKIQDGLKKYKTTLENIKQAKLDQLKDIGMDDRYMTELAKKKIYLEM